VCVSGSYSSSQDAQPILHRHVTWAFPYHGKIYHPFLNSRLFQEVVAKSIGQMGSDEIGVTAKIWRRRQLIDKPLRLYLCLHWLGRCSMLES